MDCPVATRTSRARTIRWPSWGLRLPASGRIANGKLPMQRLGSLPQQPPPQTAADLCRDIGHVGKPASQGLEIEPGTPDKNRHPSFFAQLRHQRRSFAQPYAGGIGLPRRHMAVEMMRNALHIRFGWPSRQHAQRVVDLHAVGIDHHAAVRAPIPPQVRTCRWRSARLSGSRRYRS